MWSSGALLGGLDDRKIPIGAMMPGTCLGASQ